MADKVQDYVVNSPRWLSLENFEGEVWKDTEYLYYQISNYGRLKRIAHLTTYTDVNGVTKTVFWKDKINKFTINKLGYCRFRVHLSNGNKKQVMAHRLVAIAFLNNPHNMPVINHKDENPSNNCYWNLEWCDQKYNTNYGNANKKRSKSLVKSYDGRRNVINQYSLDGELIREFHGSRELINAGFNFKGVYAVCTHRQHFSQGFVWRYNNEPFSLKNKYGNHNPRKVDQFSMDGIYIKTHNSAIEAARSVNGSSKSLIGKCCRGLSSFAYGYKWKYSDK